MKNKNLILLSLNARVGREVSARLAKELGLAFVDLREKLTEQLAEIGMLLGEFDAQSLAVQERETLVQVIAKIAQVIFVDYELYINNKELFSSETKLYLKVAKDKLDEADKINKLAFESRDRKLNSTCKVVSYENVTKAISEIKQILGDK